VTNCHKWLYVPRGCAVLYVPTRNQNLLRATLPISYGFAPLGKAQGKNDFVANFAYVGTLDDTPYLCVAAALEWRSKLDWEGKRGEEAVISYIHSLALQGGQVVSAILGTEVLDNEEASLGKGPFANVRLPLDVKPATAEEIGKWVLKTMILEYEIAVYVFPYAGGVWMRLSMQVYLTLWDFEEAGRTLKIACERADRGDWDTRAKDGL
jgi:hercynylcysteine S-oxide lyase